MIARLAKTAALAGALALTTSVGAQQDLSNPGSTFDKAPTDKNWSGDVSRTERGHLVGNPDAEGKLIEFVSYTCGHCASFAKQGDPAIDLTLLVPGKMNLEVRPVIRNYLDLTVSMLVACGDDKGFKARHRDFMWSQSIWLDKAIKAPQSQQAIWQRADKSARISMAAALDLDDKLIARGATASEINTCLSDDAAAQKLIDNARADLADFAIPGTPSFALDGKLLNNVHDWSALYPVLSQRFAPRPSTTGGQ